MDFLLNEDEFVAIVTYKWATHQRNRDLISTHRALMHQGVEKVKNVVKDVKANPFIRQNELTLDCCCCALRAYGYEEVAPTEALLTDTTIPFVCCLTGRYAEIYKNKTTGIKTSTCIRIKFNFRDPQSIHATHSSWFTIHETITKTFLECLLWIGGTFEMYMDQKYKDKEQLNIEWNDYSTMNQCITYIYEFLHKQLEPPTIDEMKEILFGVVKKKKKHNR